MNKTSKRRIPLLVSLAAAVALSVSACGHLSYNSDSGASSSNSATSAASGSSPSSGQSGATSGLTGPVSGSAGQSGGLAGGTAGGSAGGSSGQFGATGSAGGASGGTSGISTAASGLSPDEVAQYCKYFNGMYTPGVYIPGIEYQAQEPLRQLRTHTPVQLQQYVDILATDYKLITDKTRTSGQVRDEIDAAYQHLQDFHDQICN